MQTNFRLAGPVTDMSDAAGQAGQAGRHVHDLGSCSQKNVGLEKKDHQGMLLTSYDLWLF